MRVWRSVSTGAISSAMTHCCCYAMSCNAIVSCLARMAPRLPSVDALSVTKALRLCLLPSTRDCMRSNSAVPAIISNVCCCAATGNSSRRGGRRRKRRRLTMVNPAKGASKQCSDSNVGAGDSSPAVSECGDDAMSDHNEDYDIVNATVYPEASWRTTEDLDLLIVNSPPTTITCVGARPKRQLGPWLQMLRGLCFGSRCFQRLRLGVCFWTLCTTRGAHHLQALHRRLSSIQKQWW